MDYRRTTLWRLQIFSHERAPPRTSNAPTRKPHLREQFRDAPQSVVISIHMDKCEFSII